ncbi:MAG TPA: DEAD/DEAH box helicase [Gallionellaceae bacterium]
MSFASLGLSPEILRAISERGYTSPTPIQAQAIPAVLSGGDLLAGAQTGTGKTAGFTLPILQMLSQKPSTGKAPRVLVLIPTRELAAQVEESVRDYGKHLSLTSMTMIGGVNINPQITRLKSRVDILVATPGRLLDHLQQKTVDLSHIEILVLDEADRMLDMGFIRDIKKILAILPPKRQNLLFSATFSDEIKALADGLLNKPALIEVARRNAANELITQKMYPVDRERKRELLTKLIKDNNWFQVLVFTRTKHGANKLAENLTKDGIPAMAIHGNKSQAARTRALAEFKSGKLQVLCATDIAARGIDISELPHVVNFELPNVPEDYVHRIGRTGRAGSEGEASSLVCIDEHKLLHDIERLIKREIPVVQVAGFEPDPRIKAEPIANGQNRGGGQRSGQPRSHAPRGNGGGAQGGRGQGQGAGNRQATGAGQRQGQGAGQGQGRSQQAPRPASGQTRASTQPRSGAPAHARSEGNRTAVPALQRMGGRGR